MNNNFLTELEHQLSASEGLERIDLLTELAELSARSKPQRARQFADEARELATRQTDNRRSARLSLFFANLEHRSNEYQQALKLLLQTESLYLKTDDEIGLSQCYIAFGNCYLMLGQISQSLKYQLKALNIAVAAKDELNQSRALCNIGNCYEALSDYATMLDYDMKALNLEPDKSKLTPAEEHRWVENRTVILSNIGETLVNLGREQEGLNFHQRALNTARQTGNKYLECVILINISDIHLHFNDLATAQELVVAAVEIAVEIKELLQTARAFSQLGQVHRALNNLTAAKSYYEKGLQLFSEINHPLEKTRFQLKYADFLLSTGEGETAMSLIEPALRLCQENKWLAEAARAHELLVTFYKQQNDFAAALTNYEQYFRLTQDVRSENQHRRIEALLVQHEVDQTKQIAEAQRVLNERLQRANEELSETYSRNQNLLEQVQHQAHHDALTNLPNRTLFEDRLQQAITRAARHNQKFAVMFIDLDSFKLVNDTLGHQAGDELLVQVAERFKSNLRDSDTIARLGGDEFTVIVFDTHCADDARRIARKLLQSLSEPFQIRGHLFSLGASIGVALYPQDGEDVATLQKHADVAMYHVKRAGKRDVHLYSPEMNFAAMQRVSVESELNGALGRREFEVYYQPQFDARNNRITGCEALLRWTNPKLGAVGPDIFIPIAEDNGQIIEIGNWVLQTACQQLAEWRQQQDFDLIMAVNVSPLEFTRDNFVASVVDALNCYQLPFDALELEITERLVANDLTGINIKVGELRRLGIRVAIDDFGTGQSALTHLLQLPVDTLKIDRAFVRQLETSPEMRKLVGAIIALSQSMDIAVVAEGVETERQLEYLAALGCERIQGFLKARPLPVTAATALFADYFNRAKSALTTAAS